MASQFELKRLSPSTIPRALEKVHLYRVLNMPHLAESICHDVLAVEPNHTKALQELILTIADQYGSKSKRVSKVTVKELIGRLPDDYQRAYYSGLNAERRALAVMNTNAIGHAVYEWLRKAMEHYEAAIAHSPDHNDDAVLRWNTCARILNANPSLRPDDEPSRSWLS
ncbi:MAG: hypothetical protein AB8H79_10085 [Myxococcota bacterium]